MKEIRTDFQGWPIHALTLKEILKQLGFTDTGDGYFIEKGNEILNAYPRLLEDDGMGYGIDSGFITLAEKDVYDFDRESTGQEERVKSYEVMNGEKVFNLFIEEPYLEDEKEKDQNGPFFYLEPQKSLQVLPIVALFVPGLSKSESVLTTSFARRPGATAPLTPPLISCQSA